MTRKLPILLAGLLACTQSIAHEVPAKPETLSMPELIKAFNWDASKVEVTTEVVDEGFYVLFGLGGNIAVSSGDDGVLIVDDQMPDMWPKLKKAMRKQGDRDVDFAINTHWHFDHADGNLTLGKGDTWLVSHSTSRRMMQRDNVINLVGAAGLQEAYPDHALPDITFEQSMEFHLNGEQVELVHYGPAHTTGDTVVFFRGRNAVHMGDIFNNAGYPFIDAGNGGTLDGVLLTCRSVLERINGDTVVIPGHGALASYEDLENYVDMLGIVYGEMRSMIAEGKSFEEIVAANITAPWDEKMGNPAMFLNRAYVSLTTRYQE